jgi:membrane associated rhomboid family serine protease
LFLVPWQVPAFAGLFVAIHAVLAVAPLAYVQWAYVTFSLVPVRFLADDGRLVALAFANLLSYGFIHQGWLHVLINVAMLMAAAGPVNRNCGPVRMVLLFSLCCIAGGICHVLVYWGESVPVIGASAGAAGVIGAAIRYRARQLSRGEIVAPIFRPPVSTFSLFWIGINLLLFAWDSLGGGALSGYATIAHIGGYIAGLYLAPVLVKGARPRAWPPQRG